jgi:hypothetical protein
LDTLGTAEKSKLESRLARLSVAADRKLTHL